MRSLALVAAVLLLVLTGCSASETGVKTSSKRLPEVTLQPLGDGDPVALSELRGPMVVNLWASWCGPCRRELPRYEEFAEKYAGQVDVLGVDWQDTRQDQAEEMVSSSGITYPLVADPKGKLRAQALPKLILLDADGEIAFEQYVEVKSVAQLESLVEKHLKVPAA